MRKHVTAGLLGTWFLFGWFFRELGKDVFFGWVAEKLSSIFDVSDPEFMNTIAQYASYLLPAVAAGAVVYVVFYLGRRFERPGQKTQKPKPKKKQSFSPEKQRVLMATLKRNRGEHSNAKILFANVEQRPLADTIISIFDMAEWQTDLTSVPLESWIHEYFDGIELAGWNKHLLDTVTQALKKAGLRVVTTKLEPLEIPKDNPKWVWINSRIKITIGHNSDGTR